MLKYKINTIGALLLLSCASAVSAKNVNVTVSMSSTITNDTPYTFTLFSTSSPMPATTGLYTSAPAETLAPHTTTTISAFFLSPGVPYPYTYTQYQMTRENDSPVECNSVHFAPYHDMHDSYTCWVAGPHGDLPVHISRTSENDFVIQTVSHSK